MTCGDLISALVRIDLTNGRTAPVLTRSLAVMAGPTWHLVESVGIRPPARTGHVMVTGQNKLYM